MNNFENESLSKTQILGLSYYSRKDIQAAMFEFCKNRETVANFNNKFFGKRPDCFDYPSDIVNSAKNGATSFHCSEEIWENPLKIETNMTRSKYDEIRSGWDLLIDIDSKYFDFGKIALRLLCEELEKHGVRNYGIKFSGSKGFHLIVPFAAFPKNVDGDLTKNHFPDFARYIAKYLFDSIKERMNEEIIGLSGEEKLLKTGELTIEKVCPKCKSPVEEKTFYRYRCPNFKCRHEQESPIKKRPGFLCPECNSEMQLVEVRKSDFCKTCKTSTIAIEIKKEKNFEEEKSIKSQEDSVDFVLVAPRHLFRAPYSLHEKTGFASIPLTLEEALAFRPSDADPLKIKDIRNFMPSSVEGEAGELLRRAIDYHERNKPKEIETKKYEGGAIDVGGLNITEDMFPPVIKKILGGMESDGRKRALGLLLSFFTSLEFPKEYIEDKIGEWNAKNYEPIKEGYVRAQIEWALKNKRLPPNYDKPIYREFGIAGPPEPGIKNPINWTIKKAMRKKFKQARIPEEKKGFEV